MNYLKYIYELRGSQTKKPYLDISTGRPNVDPCKIDCHID